MAQIETEIKEESLVLKSFREQKDGKPWRGIPDWFVWNPAHLCDMFSREYWVAIHEDCKEAMETISDEDWQAVIDDIMGRSL